MNMNSANLLSKIFILDEVVSRPTVVNVSLFNHNSMSLYAFTGFEIDSFFQYLSFLIIFYSTRCLSKNENVNDISISFFSSFLITMTYPGFFFTSSKYYTIFSRHSYLASAKDFFED